MLEPTRKGARLRSKGGAPSVALSNARAYRWPDPRVLKPGKKLIRLLSGWSFMAACLLLSRLFLGPETALVQTGVLLWWGLGVGFGLWCVGDIWSQHLNQAPQMARSVTDSLSVGVAQAVVLVFEQLGRQTVSVRVFDHFCQKLTPHGQMPVKFLLPPGQRISVKYQVMPQTRGDACFHGCELWALSPSGLWERRFWFDVQSPVHIYPNFSAVAKAGALGLEFHMARMGIHLQQRRGQGLDFKQLRAFQIGDSLRQVDWKATARRRKPIVREYQDERGQDLVFMLDCGRAMRAKEQGLSHFDAALNALLLSAYTALRQGDRVGLQAFAGQTLWQPPLAGSGAVNTLLQRVYDLESTTAAHDYLVAAQALMLHHRKRAVVMLITNLRTGLSDNLLAACRLLAQRHVVCVVSLKEESVSRLVLEPVQTLEDAVRVSAAVSLQTDRERHLKLLRHQGIIAVEAFPKSLHSEMVRQYQSLKRSGRA